MHTAEPLSREEAYRIALNEMLVTAHEALGAEGVTDWGVGGRLGDALLGIKDAAHSVLQEGIVADSSRQQYGQHRRREPAMKVVFNVIREFLEELRLEAQAPEAVAERVLRITNLYQGVKELPALQSLTVVAGIVVRGTLLELRSYCGDVMHGAPEWPPNTEARVKAQETVDRLKGEAVQLGLTIRKGMYSE